MNFAGKFDALPICLLKLQRRSAPFAEILSPFAHVYVCIYRGRDDYIGVPFIGDFAGRWANSGNRSAANELTGVVGASCQWPSAIVWL
jgi:hypothetical protein